MKSTRLLALSIVSAFPGTALAQSASQTAYSSVYVFGDSLSDRGNLADILGANFQSPPFFHDSFTNGATAVQVMAQRLGLNANASLFPTGGQDIHNLGLTAGTNYAVAGATSGAAIGVPGANLPNQIGAFLQASSGLADANALYTVFIGGNDVRTAAHQNNAGLVTTGVATELAGITTLYNAGARNFLIVNVPDVGVIPEFQIGYPSQAATASSDSIAYNQGLASGVSAIAAANLNGSFKLFDLYGFNKGLLANSGSLGITDTTSPCYTATSIGSISAATSAACGPIDPATHQAANIGNLFYWDAIHPTAKVQFAVGNALADAVLGVPEPATWTSMIAGMACVGFALRRRRRTQSAASQMDGFTA